MVLHTKLSTRVRMYRQHGTLGWLNLLGNVVVSRLHLTQFLKMCSEKSECLQTMYLFRYMYFYSYFDHQLLLGYIHKYIFCIPKVGTNNCV